MKLINLKYHDLARELLDIVTAGDINLDSPNMIIETMAHKIHDSHASIKFFVNTPLGNLSCDAVPDIDFPSVRLYVDGIHVAILEYHSEDEELKIHTFPTIAMDDEEPIILTLKRSDEDDN